MQALPTNLRYIYKRVFHWQTGPIYCRYISRETENLRKLYAYVIMVYVIMVYVIMVYHFKVLRSGSVFSTIKWRCLTVLPGFLLYFKCFHPVWAELKQMRGQAELEVSTSTPKNLLFGSVVKHTVTVLHCITVWESWENYMFFKAIWLFGQETLFLEADRWSNARSLPQTNHAKRFYLQDVYMKFWDLIRKVLTVIHLAPK